ncbi:MAG: hypothetical protein AB1443_03720 [Pseudomonadota bacterium]
MPRVIKSFFRSVVDLLASQGGEMLSARRKSHMLQHEMYNRIARKQRNEKTR